MRLNKNMFSERILDTYRNTLVKNSKAMNNIGTGLKLNRAKDNPGKIGNSDNLKIQILCDSSAKKNIQDTNSMFQTFDGTMQEINDSLCRMKELAVQGANDHFTADDRDAIQKEMDETIKHIDYLAKNTTFNGIALIDGSVTTKDCLIGGKSDETIEINGCDLTMTGLSIGGISVSSANDAGNSIALIDNAIDKLVSQRSKYGSVQSRLEGTDLEIDSKDIELQSAQSNIADADIAEEMIEVSKNQVLVQSSIALMAQSNNFPLDALKILQNVR